jgi:hypothetical protein
VRLWLPEDDQDAPVIVCSELPTNEGSSITYAAEQLAAEVIRYHRLPTPIVWIEHHPPISTDGDTETFDLLTFSGYEDHGKGTLPRRDAPHPRRGYVEADNAWHGRGARGRGGVRPTTHAHATTPTPPRT